MKRWWAVLTAAVVLLHVGHMVSPAYSAINPMERERHMQRQQLEHSHPGNLQEHEFALPSNAAASSSSSAASLNGKDQSSSSTDDSRITTDVGDSAVESAAAKRYMRFGRNYIQQQHMAAPASGDAEKRYMRFGRREHAEQRLPMTSEADTDSDMVGSAGGLNWVNVANKRYMRFGRR